MLKEDIRELPSEEEVWEVPEPPKPDIALERGMEGTQSDTSNTSSLHLKQDHATFDRRNRKIFLLQLPS